MIIIIWNVAIVISCSQLMNVISTPIVLCSYDVLSVLWYRHRRNSHIYYHPAKNQRDNQY